METVDTDKKGEFKTVLVAEDHQYNLLVLKIMLERTGIHVIPAEDGQQAVSLCMENDNIDLVLMDLKMPVMDGYNAMREIKKMRPGMKVFAETAFALAGDKRKILEAGFDGYFAKPITKESLEELIALIASS